MYSMQDDSAYGMMPVAHTDDKHGQKQGHEAMAPLSGLQVAPRVSDTGTADSGGCIEVIAIAPDVMPNSRHSNGGGGNAGAVQEGDCLAQVRLYD